MEDAVRHYRSKKKKKIIILVLLSVLCLLTMTWVMIDYDADFWTTTIGESLFILMSFYLFFSKLALLGRNGREELLNAQEYLEHLRRRKKREASRSTPTVLFIIVSVAFFLYVYEMLAAGKTSLIIGYFTLFLFLFSMWFVYRPIMIKRQQDSIQDLLNKIDNIKNQTNEKED
jgi:amino acid permease